MDDALLHAHSTDPWHAARDAQRRIAEQDSDIQAWVTLTDLPEPATTPAAHAQGPLAGLPFGVKDVLDVAGLPTRYGANTPAPPPATYDASCVALLRQAGAVPVGKTVTAEFAFRRPGPTRNPRQLQHTPGGSSSGSAAAVAAGMVPLALGTQTGGSIIRPAAFCGVVGFKPSFGLLSRDGLKLTCESLDTLGWFTPTVAETLMIAQVLLPLPDSSADVRPVRIAIVTDNPELAPDADALHALSVACERLREHGVDCTAATRFTQGRQLADAHQAIMAYEFARNLLPVAQQHAEHLSTPVRETIEIGLAMPAAQYRAHCLVQRNARSQWETWFGNADLVITPSASGTAPKGLANTGSSAFNRQWTLLGWPCLHLPMGLTPAGLPIGIQVVGRFEEDMRLLRQAAWMQDIVAGPPDRPA